MPVVVEIVVQAVCLAEIGQSVFVEGRVVRGVPVLSQT